MSNHTPRLISSLDEAKASIRRFHEELKNPLLVDLLGSFRAWYAITDTDGEILLAPSKFIGYQALTARIYLELNKKLDGRDTEAVLSRWFSSPEHDATEEFLHEKLANLLSPFGKKPGKLARISTINGSSLVPGEEPRLQGNSPADALLVLFRMLSAEDQLEFRKRIK